MRTDIGWLLRRAEPTAEGAADDRDAMAGRVGPGATDDADALGAIASRKTPTREREDVPGDALRERVRGVARGQAGAGAHEGARRGDRPKRQVERRRDGIAAQRRGEDREHHQPWRESGAVSVQ
ncbi:MAG: hypothetical protein IPG04_37490 [Polyangiaceae bacterium]|nr:hypothetical protein [Polyangiaceae bacterium]